MKNENEHEREHNFSFKGITGSPIQRVVYKTTLALGIIAAVGLASMMLVSIYDITARFFFKNPLYGVYELVGMILVLTSTFGMALCQKDKSHITINLITDLFPPKLKTFSEAFGLLMSFICFGIITWRMFIDTIEFFERGMGGLSSDLGINWGYASGVFVVGSFLFSVVLLLQFVQTVRRMWRR